ncbi:MAG: FAD synthetase family protein [Spirochaetales bacterium]|nr:FAD synthetase family protein [Spirochaetales bacterium]
MEIIDWKDLTQGKKQINREIALTIGVFDGVHIGHQKLIRTITHTQKEIIPGVATFTPNPASVLRTAPFPGSILTIHQKLTKLKLFGISLVILIDFSFEFSKITGKEFWLSLLKNLHLKKIVVGQNFHFGYKRKGGIDTLTCLSPGIMVDVVEPVLYKGKIVSSTRIRALIQQGKFKEVTFMLGNSYDCDVSTKESIRIKSDLWGFDVKGIEQVLPVKGDYPVMFKTDNGNVTCNLTIKDNIIQWKKNADYGKIKNIIFI